MNSGFIHQILVIAVIAILGVGLAAPAVVATEVEKHTVFIEYDGLIPVSDGIMLTSHNPVGEFSIKCIDAKKISMQVNGIDVETPEVVEGKANFKVFFEEEYNEISIAVADEQGKELKCVTFYLEVE